MRLMGVVALGATAYLAGTWLSDRDPTIGYLLLGILIVGAAIGLYLLRRRSIGRFGPRPSRPPRAEGRLAGMRARRAQAPPGEPAPRPDQVAASEPAQSSEVETLATPEPAREPEPQPAVTTEPRPAVTTELLPAAGSADQPAAASNAQPVPAEGREPAAAPYPPLRSAPAKGFARSRSACADCATRVGGAARPGGPPLVRSWRRAALSIAR